MSCAKTQASAEGDDIVACAACAGDIAAKVAVTLHFPLGHQPIRVAGSRLITKNNLKTQVRIVEMNRRWNRSGQSSNTVADMPPAPGNVKCAGFWPRDQAPLRRGSCHGPSRKAGKTTVTL